MGILSHLTLGGDGRSEKDSVLAVPAEGVKPSTMKRPEPLYGYLVALELLVVAVLNVTVTTGKGAPVHPNTTLEVLGVAASVALFGIIRTNNRMAAGFGAIVAAFFVTLPQVPSRLAVAHIFALIIPMAYGLIITQRQRRATPKAARGRAGRAGDSSPSTTAAGSAGTRPGRKSRGKTPEPVSGPRPNARYTPPKAKRKPAK